MTLQTLQQILGWSALINIAAFILWLLFFIFARDFMFRMHTRWFKLDATSFDKLHYQLMGIYKLCIFLFVITPYLAIHIIS